MSKRISNKKIKAAIKSITGGHIDSVESFFKNAKKRFPDVETSKPCPDYEEAIVKLQKYNKVVKVLSKAINS